MKDPYVWPNADVLINRHNIKDKETLNQLEADIVAIQLSNIDQVTADDKLDLVRLQKIHRHLLGDIYPWAGELRTCNIIKEERVLSGKSVDYTDHTILRESLKKNIRSFTDIPYKEFSLLKRAEAFSIGLAAIWRDHPFREGNTRTIMTFAVQTAEARGIPLDKSLFAEHPQYTRDALVMASLGTYAEPQYLVRIIKDAMVRGPERQKGIKKLER